MLTKGREVSRYDVNELLEFFGYKRRRLIKSESLKDVPARNDQFEHIGELQKAFIENGFACLSIDTKNKELIGNFYRSGTYFGQESQRVYDHDFPSYSSAKLIPHGIYDLADNKGYLSLGISHDTSQFVCDNIEHYWKQELQWKYQDSDWMLLLCDSGGSNNCRHYLFKQDVYQLAQKLQINVVVAHYPTYCSKYNPIERKLFCHIHRQWEGVAFKNIRIVKELAEKTSTQTGLEVKVRVNKKHYNIKRKYQQEFKHNIENYIIFGHLLPLWNYMVFYKPL